MRAHSHSVSAQNIGTEGQESQNNY
ncbi:hypothetical protein [Chryseobacterium sp. ISL-6]